jgi:hypothetical protein
MLKQSNTPQTPILIEDLGMKFPTEISKYKIRYGLYKCHCGIEFKTITANIKNGRTQSCGCFKKEVSTKHNMSNHPLYGIWNAIIARTSNPNNAYFINYGGRGIKVCKRWLDIENFIEDMYSTYKLGLTIDRIDNNKGYEPFNCRWVTMKVQQRNKRVIMSTNTSGYRGVSWHKAVNKWIAQIGVDGKSVYLGLYADSIDAAMAYDNYVIDNNLEHTINNVTVRIKI